VPDLSQGIMRTVIHELKRSESLKVRSLFKEPHLNLVISSVAECNTPGRIWVDDPISPQTVFIWDKAHSFYLVGSPDNEEYNLAVEVLMHEQIMPEARKRELFIFKLYGSLEVWEAILKSFLFKKMERKARRFYAFKRREIDSLMGEIPYGFAMKRIDARFLKEYSLKNTPGLLDEISSSWDSFDDYLKKGFGFALVHGGVEIACWCAAEYVSKNKCGIGIETIQKYQRRGFATLTACAFVDHCASNDIAPYWDCWDDNIGSIRVAEKVSFELAEKYDVFFGSLS